MKSECTVIVSTEVSESVRNAGLFALERFVNSYPDYLLVEQIYIAMVQAAAAEQRQSNLFRDEMTDGS